MAKSYCAIALTLVCLSSVHSKAQKTRGPQGVLVNNCVTETSSNGTFHFMNNCSYIIEVAVAQPYPNGEPGDGRAVDL